MFIFLLVIFAYKRFYMKKHLIFLVLLPSLVLAQNYSRDSAISERILSGFVLDSLSQNSLPYASISLLDSESSSRLKGSICDQNGGFSIEKIPVGSYDLLIEYMGYTPKLLKGVEVRKQDVQINIGPILLRKFVEELQEVELLEKNTFVVQEIDKKVFNVSQDEANSSGSALGLMQSLPSVEVDVEGNVSLRGSDQVRLYVDGKSSLQSSSDLLENLPASMIESVELITNPSVKYSPEGMSGIINIVLKKNKARGFNGSGSLTMGYPDRRNFSATINRRSKKLNLYSSYSIMAREGAFTSESEKQTYFDEETFYLKQDKRGGDYRKSHTLKAGLDFTPNPRNYFTLEGKFIPSERIGKDTVLYNQTSVNGFSSFDRLTHSASVNGSSEFSLSGRSEWSNGLKSDLYLSQSNQSIDKSDHYTETLLNQNDWVGNAPIYEQLTNERVDDKFESKLDFSIGNEDHGKWEWGLSYRIRQMDQDQFSDLGSTYLDGSSLDNRFVYEDEVYAAYLNYAKAYGLWSFQTGLRAEQMSTRSYLDQIDSVYTTSYHSLYPSLYLSYNMDELSSVQVSYSRRVNRPKFRALNPFPKYSDPYNLRMGNPFLKPEFVNSYELGFQKYNQGGSFTASVFAKDIHDKQRRFIAVDSNNVSRVTYQNLNSTLNVGVEFLWSKKISSRLNLRLGSSIYHSKMDASNLTSTYEQSAIRMRSNFNFSWSMKGHKLQISGWVRPGGQVGQGKMKTMFNTDLVYAKNIFSDKGKFTVKISDVFNTSGFGIDTYGKMFDQSFSYKRQSRILSISLSCNFGRNNESPSSRKKKGNYNSPRDTDGGYF